MCQGDSDGLSQEGQTHENSFGNDEEKWRGILQEQTCSWAGAEASSLVAQ